MMDFFPVYIYIYLILYVYIIVIFFSNIIYTVCIYVRIISESSKQMMSIGGVLMMICVFATATNSVW